MKTKQYLLTCECKKVQKGRIIARHSDYSAQPKGWQVLEFVDIT